MSTDDFAGWLALQVNLALKGIIGIKAMSEMADLVGETEDAKYFKVRIFQDISTSTDRGSEYIRCLHPKMGRIRHLPGWHTRQTSL